MIKIKRATSTDQEKNTKLASINEGTHVAVTDGAGAGAGAGAAAAGAGAGAGDGAGAGLWNGKWLNKYYRTCPSIQCLYCIYNKVLNVDKASPWKSQTHCVEVGAWVWVTAAGVDARVGALVWGVYKQDIFTNKFYTIDNE